MSEVLVDEPVVRPNRRFGWAVGVLLFVLTFVVYAATISHDTVSLDVWTANFASWHLTASGHPWLEGVRIDLLAHNPVRQTWVLHATNGHTVIGRSPGVIAAALPAYWLLHLTMFSTVPGGLSASAVTAGSVTFVFLTLRRYLSVRDAVLAAVVFGFATPVWSVSANAMWPHTVTVFGICGMAWASTTGRWWWVGAFGGITLWGRLHAAVIVAVVGLLVGFRRRSSGVVVRVGAASGLLLVLMSAWTRWMYGTWNPTASYDTGPFADYAGAHPIDPVNQLGFWIAPDRGILVWTPIILLLLPAVASSWRDLPDWSRSLVWAGLTYTLLQGVLNRFSGGEVFYGYRLGLEFLACATPAFALATPRIGRIAGSLLGPALALQFLAIAYGAARDGAWLPLDQAWHHNAFLEALGQNGVVGWVSLALAVGVGALAGRVWRDLPALPPTARR